MKSGFLRQRRSAPTFQDRHEMATKVPKWNQKSRTKSRTVRRMFANQITTEGEGATGCEARPTRGFRRPGATGLALGPGRRTGRHGWRAYGRRHVLSRPVVAIRPARLDLRIAVP
jgi:hypothetical protein